MKTAAGIIGIIGAIFGFFAALITLFVGGAGSAFKADGADAIIAFGWGGVFFSFLCIILAAICIPAKGRIPGFLLLISAITGAILGGTLVAVCMVLCMAAGIVGMFGNKKKLEKSA